MGSMCYIIKASLIVLIHYQVIQRYAHNKATAKVKIPQENQGTQVNEHNQL